MTKDSVEVITSVQRRRRWSAAEKERLVAASLEPGAVASEVARAAGIHPSQLFAWRRQMCVRRADAPGFAEVQVTDPMPAGPAPTIEIAFASGTRVRISGGVDSATASAVVAAVAERRG
ncbi:MAG TPA: transposase [Bacillota bacterium]